MTDRILNEGLTFDDVLLVPAYSEVLPREVNLKCQFTRNISLNIPVVSAAMDTVTESKMAIAIAREGGIGVIHKNMSIAEQAAEVRRVKRAENGLISDPITITAEQTVGDAEQLMHDNHIGGIPVVSAAMDTVTESKMAIAIAREGGIGVIHKNMSIAEQAAEVRRVKRAENGLISDPITITA